MNEPAESRLFFYYPAPYFIHVRDSCDFLVLGAGPAGIGAMEALAGEDVVWIGELGGKLSLCPDIRNYPGLDSKVRHTGDEVLCYMLGKLDSIYEKPVRPIDAKADLKTLTADSITVGGQEIRFKACVLAAGSDPIHKFADACVSCPDDAPKKVVVLGGGNAALKCAIEMMSRGSDVAVVHRRNEFRASKSLVDEFKKEGGKVFTPYVTLKVEDSFGRKSVALQEVDTHALVYMEVDCAIECYGQSPNSPTGSYLNPGELYENLYIAGDVLDSKAKGIYKSEIEGKKAAEEAKRRIKG